jgi:concanavalin A-like lectin/glucanase superfamily protein
VAGQTTWDNHLGANYHVAAPRLAFYETFDSQSALIHPSVGPAGTLTGTATLVAGTQGEAYYGDTATSAALAYPSAIVPADRGTIEFDAKLYTPPAVIPWHDSPFFFLAGIGDYSQYAIGFNGNDGWSGGGLVGWAAHGNSATGCWTNTVKYTDVLGASGAETWHHYALVWDKDGVPGLTNTMQVYVDGVPVGTSLLCGENHTPVAFPQPTQPFYVGYIQDNFGGSAFAIDELKIWNWAKTP